MNVIEQGGRIRPVTADGFYGIIRGESTLPADEAILDPALAVRSMTNLGVQIRHARMAMFVMEVRWRDVAHKLLERRLRVDRINWIYIADAWARLGNTTKFDIF